MAITSDKFETNLLGYEGDTPHLRFVEDRASIRWTITAAPVVKRSENSEEDAVAEHGADYLLFLTVDGQSFSRPLYGLMDHEIEDTMSWVAEDREVARRKALLKEKKVISVV